MKDLLQFKVAKAQATERLCDAHCYPLNIHPADGKLRGLTRRNVVWIRAVAEYQQQTTGWIFCQRHA